MINKIYLIFSYIILIFLVTSIVFEFIYRVQIFDTYLPELNAYNPSIKNAPRDKRMLVFGDSFTADESYLEWMRKIKPDYEIINSGVCGTGIVQTLIMVQKRIKRFDPSIIIYQIYVGNDLLNIKYPINWRKGHFLINSYWTLERYFRSLGFLAYRLSQFKFFQSFFDINKIGNKDKSKMSDVFDPQKYVARTKTYLIMNPSYLEETILVSGRSKTIYNEFLKKLDKLISICESSKRNIYILVIPHSCQVGRGYFNNMQVLGAEFSVNSEKIQEDEYPFIEGIIDKFKNKDGIYILNPLQFFKNLENTGQKVYFSNDSHLNILGQRILGEYVAKEISE